MCTVAFWILAYGYSGEFVDEYVRMGASLATLCLISFSSAMVRHFGGEYLRIPTQEDAAKLS